MSSFPLTFIYFFRGVGFTTNQIKKQKTPCRSLFGAHGAHWIPWICRPHDKATPSLRTASSSKWTCRRTVPGRQSCGKMEKCLVCLVKKSQETERHIIFNRKTRYRKTPQGSYMSYIDAWWFMIFQVKLPWFPHGFSHGFYQFSRSFQVKTGIFQVPSSVANSKKATICCASRAWFVPCRSSRAWLGAKGAMGSHGKPWWFHDGSMVLPYSRWHGSHQYTPFMLAYIPAPWIRHGYIFFSIFLNDFPDFWMTFHHG